MVGVFDSKCAPLFAEYRAPDAMSPPSNSSDDLQRLLLVATDFCGAEKRLGPTVACMQKAPVNCVPALTRVLRSCP